MKFFVLIFKKSLHCISYLSLNKVQSVVSSILCWKLSPFLDFPYASRILIRISCILIQCLPPYIIGTLRSNYADGIENVKKNNRFDQQNKNFARAPCFFVHFSARFCSTTTWTCLISRFMEDADKQRRNFLEIDRRKSGSVIVRQN